MAAVVDEAAEAADVAARAHGLAVTLVVHPEHTDPAAASRTPHSALIDRPRIRIMEKQ